MEPDKTIRRTLKNGRPRRDQTSFGHVQKSHFVVSVFWLSKWNRVRNVLLEVMHRIARNCHGLIGKMAPRTIRIRLHIDFISSIVRFYILSTSALLRSDFVATKWRGVDNGEHEVDSS
jgi:hypothetical protein